MDADKTRRRTSSDTPSTPARTKVSRAQRLHEVRVRLQEQLKVRLEMWKQLIHELGDREDTRIYAPALVKLTLSLHDDFDDDDVSSLEMDIGTTERKWKAEFAAVKSAIMRIKSDALTQTDKLVLDMMDTSKPRDVRATLLTHRVAALSQGLANPEKRERYQAAMRQRFGVARQSIFHLAGYYLRDCGDHQAVLDLLHLGVKYCPDLLFSCATGKASESVDDEHLVNLVEAFCNDPLSARGEGNVVMKSFFEAHRDSCRLRETGNILPAELR